MNKFGPCNKETSQGSGVNKVEPCSTETSQGPGVNKFGPSSSADSNEHPLPKRPKLTSSEIGNEASKDLVLGMRMLPSIIFMNSESASSYGIG